MANKQSEAWTKVHRKDLDLETLKTFNIPWEWDQTDPGYIIIKQFIPEDSMRPLFEHTRLLRQARTAPPAIQRQPAMYIDLKDQFFEGPQDYSGRNRLYASFGVVEPIITVEKHAGKLHISARFNLETTILNYSSHKSDGHELFFHDVCLQYLHDSADETLVMTPQSDASVAFKVTRSSETAVNPQVGLNLSAAPSGNVSLGLTRSTGLTVEYAVGSWSLSAHHISNKSTGQKLPRYQWFWAGTHDDTKRLTPDLRHTVTRHVVVKRIIPASGFPLGIEGYKQKEGKRQSGVSKIHSEMSEGDTESGGGKRDLDESETTRRLLRALKRYFTFSFYVQIRVKKRYGRFHRLLILSFNEVKAGFLKPNFARRFDIRAQSDWLKGLIYEGMNPSTGPRERSQNEASGINNANEPESDPLEKKEPDKTSEKDGDSDSNKGGQSDSEGGHDSSNTNGNPEPAPFEFPLGETVDIAVMLHELRERNKGNWDALQGRNLVDVMGRQHFRPLKTVESVRLVEIERRMEMERLMVAQKRKEMEKNEMRMRENIGKNTAQREFHVERRERPYKQDMEIVIDRGREMAMEREMTKRMGRTREIQIGRGP
ncbi:hypothetical protein BGW36DRAFT_433961 [Talaromyces proteolyticus]|uniref:Uncharacterized protein n=1 Tax=Talaromyces proteolyticus TaxID=1131652 RepID=A0AAD4KDK3_9EURO|nr:uncharacterized protein BGW36DRAFT_433961 [Talaromyces proteolyticus]KAH8689197.1 hypothetical protein BGW36DRAFT_433961 [Talaromyces proteolyticus]